VVRGQRVASVELEGGHVTPALGLGHVLGGRDVGIVVEREDHARHAALKILGNVPLELTLYVILPRHHPFNRRRHQADLAVDEDGVGLEGRVLREGTGGVLLEAGDPRRIYGHPNEQGKTQRGPGTSQRRP